LTASATTAVQKLVAAGALRSKDIRPPSVYPQVVTFDPSRPTRLTYSVIEDSHRSRETIRVYEKDAQASCSTRRSTAPTTRRLRH